MKRASNAALICVGMFALLGAVYSADVSPISRVVKLLQDLGKQIEHEAKEEEKMFEEYICWGKKIVDTKTASNSAAESRIDMLKQYLADIDAGRVEFTSERQDLEKEIEEHMADLDVAKSMRQKETEDFEVAEEEMKQAIGALEDAVEVLGKATKDSKSALVAVKTRVNEGFAERVAEGTRLNQAVKLGEKFLSRGDAVFLRRLLTGEVPKADWKKLNRKATFKMKYKARSGSIQDTLKKLLSTFQSNLKDATAKESAAKESYDKLRANKQGQLDKAQESLSKMEKEMGARGMSKADTQEEVADLETQVKNDVKFIEDTRTSMNTKTEEWKARSQIRAQEGQAISQAVAILASDNARDGFKKSLSSQGFFFLQTSQKSALINRAGKQIEQLMRSTNDQRLASILSSVTTGHFDAVIKSIDKMVAMLKEETETDLTNKQDCESTRMKDVRDAISAGREVDDLTDSINSLTADIKELNGELDGKKADLKAAQDEMKQATKIRDEENAEWKVSDQEDLDASQTVGDAMDVLKKFYEGNGFMLFQQKQPAGEAPPPPPSTWEGSYTGKTGEAGGILGILTLCQQDIDKDRSSAKADEDEAQAAYDKAKEAFEAQEKLLNTAISELEGQIGAKETSVETKTKSRGTKKGELDATMKKISNADSGCNYIEVNYPLRLKNRQIEVDGLLKAKAILEGAAFAKPADENREIKPGDALIQRTLRRH
jgi:chromosome segregation ATPase